VGLGRAPTLVASHWRPSPKAVTYAVLVVLGLVASLLSGRPEAAVLAVPFAVALAAGLAATPPLELAAMTSVTPTVVTSGDEVAVAASFVSSAGVPAVEVFFCPGPLLARAEPARRPMGIRLPAGEHVHVEMVARAWRWGNAEVGQISFRASSFLGFFEAEGVIPVEATVMVYPTPQALRRLVRSREVNLAGGAQAARSKAPGPEPAGVRPFAHGDRAKDVNWRASARHQGLFTNERHPERSTDVVLVLDTFDPSVLDRAVTAACSLADAYLAQRDRLAVVKFGGTLRWLRPGQGLRQRYLVVDVLLSTAVRPSAVHRGVDLLPPRILPAGSLVVALSSLEEQQSRAAFTDMRARGLDVVVIEVPPPAFTRPRLGPAQEPALGLWRLQRAMNRDALRSDGIPTVPWPPGRSLAEVLEEVAAWPRQRAHRPA
jgi:uncharacterized protein (DUF58 family)